MKRVGSLLFLVSTILICFLIAFEIFIRIPLLPPRLFVWFLFFLCGLLFYSIYLIYREKKEEEYENYLRKFRESRK